MEAKKLSGLILAFAPLVTGIVFLAETYRVFMRFIKTINREDFANVDNEIPVLWMSQTGPLLPIGILCSAAQLGALAYFIYHAVKNKNLTEGNRIVWIIVFVFAGVVGFPVYWFVQIKKQNIVDSGY